MVTLVQVVLDVVYRVMNESLLELAGLWFSAFTSASLLPGTSEMVLAYLWYQQHSMIALWCVATSGNVAGSVLNYWLGSQFRRFSNRAWYPRTSLEHDKTKQWMQRYGAYTLLLSWLPVVGDPLTLMAGVFRISLSRFIGFVLIAKGGRYAVVLLFADQLLRPWIQP